MTGQPTGGSNARGQVQGRVPEAGSRWPPASFAAHGEDVSVGHSRQSQHAGVTLQPQAHYEGARGAPYAAATVEHAQSVQGWPQNYGIYGPPAGVEDPSRQARKAPASSAGFDGVARDTQSTTAQPLTSMQPPTLDTGRLSTGGMPGAYQTAPTAAPYTAAVFGSGASPMSQYGRAPAPVFGQDMSSEFGHSRYASMSSAYDMPISRSFDASNYGAGAPNFPLSPPSARVTLKAKRKRASPQQLGLLNNIFEKTFFPSTELRNALGKELAMTSRTVQIWFQNRRQAWRSQRGKDAHMSETISNDNERAAWEVFRDFQAKRASGELPTINNVGDVADSLTISTGHGPDGMRRMSMGSDRTLRTASSFAQSTPRQTPRSANYEHGPLSAGFYESQPTAMQPMSPYGRGAPGVGGMSTVDSTAQPGSIKSEPGTGGMLPPLQALNTAQQGAWGQAPRYGSTTGQYYERSA